MPLPFPPLLTRTRLGSIKTAIYPPFPQYTGQEKEPKRKTGLDTKPKTRPPCTNDDDFRNDPPIDETNGSIH